MSDHRFKDFRYWVSKYEFKSHIESKSLCNQCTCYVDFSLTVRWLVWLVDKHSREEIYISINFWTIYKYNIKLENKHI